MFRRGVSARSFPPGKECRTRKDGVARVASFRPGPGRITSCHGGNREPLRQRIIKHGTLGALTNESAVIAARVTYHDRLFQQRRTKLNLRAGERDRNGTGFPRQFGLFLELFVINPGHVGFRLQFDCRDLESSAGSFKRHLRSGADAFRRVARLFQVERERHGKATGFRGAEQFLGVGAGSIFKARFERVGALKCAAPELHRALPLFEGAFPNR